MRNKLRRLMGRDKASDLKPVVSLALSRIAVLKQQRLARCSQARADLLLLLSDHPRALLRVEHVIRDQNMLDVYDLLDAFCHLILDRVHLIQHQRECPDEVTEAASSLIYAASRCGDFPELHQIRSLLTCQFGNDFAARAVELRNNCGVSLTMIQKLSTRQPSLDHRMAVLQQIASSANTQHQASTPLPVDPTPTTSLSSPPQNKYKDVADAAQAAFESAAHAAAAARAAVELSRPPHEMDSATSDDDDAASSTTRLDLDKPPISMRRTRRP